MIWIGLRCTASLEGDDRIVRLAHRNARTDAPIPDVLTVCENGYGKRTDVAEYRLTKRGGKGVTNTKTTERNGRVIAIRAVQDTDGLMLITAKGIMLRTDLRDLREIGRATQGVRLIRLDEGDTVVGVAKIVQEDDEDESSGNEPASDSPGPGANA